MAKNNKSRKGKWIVISVIAMALLGVGAWNATKGDGEDPEYLTATLVRGDLIRYVTATGQLNPVTNVQVGSQISGIIARLFADWNSTVTNGQIIAQIDSSTYRANVLQVESDLTNSVAALELARINARRSKELCESKLIPQSDYDTAIASLHQAEAVVLGRKAALANARVNLNRCTIYSPVDGVVISRNVDVGQTVAASLSAPTLFVIANDLTKMQIDANVAEADVGGIELGQKVEFTVDAFPNQTFRGEVWQVRYSPVIVQNVVTYSTVVSVSNPDLKLRPGMTASVSIIVAERNNVLKIPNAALRFRPPDAMAASRVSAPQRGGGSGADGRDSSSGGSRGRNRPDIGMTRTVYTPPAGSGASASTSAKPTRVQIKVGLSDGVSTEVGEGLKEGDIVITGTTMTETAQAAQPPANPFSGRGVHLH